MPSSPNLDLEKFITEPYLLWIRDEFQIKGQPANRVTIQVTFTAEGDQFKCKANATAAKDIVRPIPSSLVLIPDFDINTKASMNQQLCFSQYLFKKQKKQMKLDIEIPKEKQDLVTKFVKSRPAVRARNFVRTPLDYQTWLVPVRQVQSDCLQCHVYFVKWDFFDSLCDDRYKLSLKHRKLNLLVHVEHALADVEYDPSALKKDKKAKPKVTLKIAPELFRPLLEHFDITLISEYPMNIINEVVRQLGCERDQFLDKFHRRLFGNVAKTSQGLFSLAQYFEFYHFRRRRNSVLAVADPLTFAASDRDYIFQATEPKLSERLISVQREFFAGVQILDDAKSLDLQGMILKLRNQWSTTS